MKPAPLFADAFRLYTWLHGHFAGSPDPLARAIVEQALALLEALTLALKGRERDLQIDRADELLLLLRVRLRLAAALGLLTQAQLLHALEGTDGLGRQLGGWQQSLEAL